MNPKAKSPPIEGNRVRPLMETAALIGVSYSTFQRMRAKGEVPPIIHLSDGRYGVRDSDREAWLSSRVVEPMKAKAGAAA